MMVCNSFKKKGQKGDQISFRIDRLKCKVPLIHLRAFLILINLTVLASAIASFLAGRNTGSEDNSHDLKILLYITSFNLLFYWLIYGVAIPLNFGGSCEMCVLVISVPHTLFMVMWEVGMVAVFVNMMQVDHHQMAGFSAAWIPTLATIFMLSCLVQLITTILPFFISSFQYKGDDKLPIKRRRIWHTNTEMPTQHVTPQTSCHANNTDYVDFNPEVYSLYHTEMPEQILRKTRPGAIARIRKSSLSARQAVMDTMSKVYSENSIWRLIRGNNPYELSLEAADDFDGNYKSYDVDYMDMRMESPPPSYHSQEFLV